MSKLISAVFAAAFAVATVSPAAFAQEKKEKAEPSKAAVDAACKDKMAGDVVKVDGKDVKCPAPKK
jgi:pentapeptide MXKDX repeat protein